MEKKLLSLAVAAAVVSPINVLADAPEVSGFIDIIYTATDEASDVPGGKNTTEGKFTAEGEVDFVGQLNEQVTVTVDVDVMDTPGGASASANLEQARFDWSLTDDITLTGGLFNNPVGWEGHDAPALFQTTHGLIWHALDDQTREDGNNLIGLAVTADLGLVTGVLALTDDIGGADEENSLALVVGVNPIEGVEAELGYVTQDNDDATVCPGGGTLGLAGCGMGNHLNLNATVTQEISGFGLTGAVEIQMPDEVVDQAYMLMANATVGDTGFGGTLRLENISFDASGVDDLERTTLAGTYQAQDNLAFLLEWSNTDNGTNDNDLITIEMVGLF